MVIAVVVIIMAIANITIDSTSHGIRYHSSKISSSNSNIGICACINNNLI